MNRRFWMYAVMGCVAPASVKFCNAQPPDEEKDPEALLAPRPKKEAVPVPVVHLVPGPAPLEMHRYLLEVDYHTKKPGDTLEIYMKPRKERVEKFKKENAWLENISELVSMPQAQLPREVEKIRAWDLLKEMDEAAGLSTADWRKVTFELKNPLPGEIMQLMEMTNYLWLRGRAELKAGDYPAMVKTACTMLTMARVVGDGPNLIHHLVGIAIGQNTVNLLLEGMGKPGVPNLYWAWKAVPEKGIPFRRSISGEAYQINMYLPGLRDMLLSGKIRKIPDRELDELVDKVFAISEISDAVLGFAVGGKPKEKSPLGEMWEKARFRKQVANLGPYGREFLQSRGISKKELDEISDIQAAFLGEVAYWEELVDEFCKWTEFPLYIATPELNKFQAKVTARPQPESGLKRGFLIGGGDSSGSTVKSFMVMYQSNCQFNRLLKAVHVMEALRLHAAATGAWPSTLDEIRLVPVPGDPTTGKPFLYKRNGKKAILETESRESENMRHHKWELVLEGAK